MRHIWTIVLAATALTMLTNPAAAQEELAPYLRDRGPGVTSSLFGTYITGGDFLVYPFYEYVKNTGEEYKGSELGFSNDNVDYLGRFELHQALLFLAYGITEDIALEVEMAIYEDATLRRAANDTTSGMPAQFSESGIGAAETNLRWRLRRETASSPEIFSYLEIAYPFQKSKKLIGVSEWEGVWGFGVVKGFSFGTLTVRGEMAYDGADDKIEFGEWAIEYLKRLSDSWRLVATLEGESDEVSIIGELQWHITPNAFFKFNSGFGLTNKAPNIAPEIGIMFVF